MIWNRNANIVPFRRRLVTGRRQQGVTMVEFTLVAPVITLVGLLCLQWALSFHGRNQMQHAGFMAARAGATAQAQPGAIEAAYARALAPLYGGGQSLAEVEASAASARADLAGRLRIEILNPTAESFADWSDPALQQRLGAPRRVIPNEGLGLLTSAQAGARGAASGQTLADANQLKLRITAGLPLQVPFAAPLVRQVLIWSDSRADPFSSALRAEGRLPVTVDVMVRMQSPPMESEATRAMAELAQAPAVEGPATGRPPLPAACSTVGCANPVAQPVSSRSPSTVSGVPATSSGSAAIATPQPVEMGDPLFCTFPS